MRNGQTGQIVKTLYQNKLLQMKGRESGVPRVEQPMGHKEAKLAATETEALMKNIINLDEEVEVLTDLERETIVVGLDLGAELKRSNELLRKMKSCL